MMSRREWLETEKLTSLIGLIGNVDSYKKLKSILYLNSTEFPGLIKYKWDKRFFGPNSTELINLLEGATEKAFLEESYLQPTNENEPIHHGYRPTLMTQAYIKNRLNPILDEFHKSGVINVEEFLEKMIALRSLPTAVALNEALQKFDSDNKLRKYPKSYRQRGCPKPKEKIEDFRYIRSDFSIHFNKENIAQLKSYYEDKGIFLSQLPNENYYHAKLYFDREKIKNVIEERYKYLRLNNISENGHKIQKIYDDIQNIGLKMDETKIEEKRKSYLAKIKQKDYIDESNERLDFVLGNFENILLDAELETSQALEAKFYYSSAFELIVSGKYKQKQSKWNDNYLIDLYHLMQPFEWLTYFSKSI